MEQAHLTIRLADENDGAAIRRLAELDSSDVPEGPLLLAESGSRLVAALSTRTEQSIADPFVRTLAVVELLWLRSRQLRGAGADGRELWRRLGLAQLLRIASN